MTAVAQGIKILLAMASIPLMARLLDPEDFGLLGMATVFTGFAAMFVSAGMSVATIQRESITRQQVSNLFWIASLLGLLIAGIVAASSPLIAWFYQEPRLVGVIIALSTSFIFSGLTIQHQALLRRGMQFRWMAAADVLSVFCSLLISALWAWHYYDQENDYWSLVLAPITMAATRLIITWFACGWVPDLPSRHVGTKELVFFGANLTGFNFANYLSRNADNLLIGWYWDKTLLGYYERAYKLFLYPIQGVNVPMSNVMIPALSRVANNKSKYETVYFQVLQLMLTVVSPAMIVLSVTSDWWIRYLLGEPYAPAAPIFRWLTIVGVIQTFTNTSSWLFVSQGKSKELLSFGLIASVLTIAGFAVGLPWGPTGVAFAYAIGGLFLRVPLLVYWMHRTNTLDYRKLLTQWGSVLPLWGIVLVANVWLVLTYTSLEPATGVLYCSILSVVVWGVAGFCIPTTRQVLMDAMKLRKFLSTRTS